MGKSNDQPSNWPTDIRYLSQLSSSRNLSSAAKTRYCTPLPAPVSALPSAKSIRIQLIKDAEHPANGQRGLFACRKLPANTWLVDYIGQVHTEAESDPLSDYDLSLEDGYAIDAAREGNEARKCNDYRGTGKERPNVEFRLRKGLVQGKEVVRMSLWTKTEVNKGEECLASYGRYYWKKRQEELEAQRD